VIARPEKPQGAGSGSAPGWRQYAGMGTELAGAICGLTLLGLWIDRHYGTGNKATITGVTIGMVGGMYNFLRQAVALSRRMEQRDVHARSAGNATDTGSDESTDR